MQRPFTFSSSAGSDSLQKISAIIVPDFTIFSNGEASDTSSSVS